MRSSLLTSLGLVVVLVGLVWTAQGIGWLGGSAMSGETLWAVVGPLVALVGAAIAYAGVRGRR
ncbi:hypothetical protein ACVW00_002091 [Marmoricola sp. URHA0025 HA25]